ncbi:MAG: type II toxin-antitoxin system PemK/MazF family toxin [Candidatus Binataceae bacterium]
MRRGDIVTVSAPGDYGKPRPAVIVQSDSLRAADSVLVSLLTSTLRDAPIFRLTVEPRADNGLRATSQVMVDKLAAVSRGKCGRVIGRLDQDSMVVLNRMLSVVLGLAD